MKVPGAHGRHVETPQESRHSEESSDKLSHGAREPCLETRSLLCTSREIGTEKENSRKGIWRKASQRVPGLPAMSYGWRVNGG